MHPSCRKEWAYPFVQVNYYEYEHHMAFLFLKHNYSQFPFPIIHTITSLTNKIHHYLHNNSHVTKCNNLLLHNSWKIALATHDHPNLFNLQHRKKYMWERPWIAPVSKQQHWPEDRTRKWTDPIPQKRSTEKQTLSWSNFVTRNLVKHTPHSI